MYQDVCVCVCEIPLWCLVHFSLCDLFPHPTYSSNRMENDGDAMDTNGSECHLPAPAQFRQEFERLRAAYPFLEPRASPNEARWTLQGMSPLNVDIYIDLFFTEVNSVLVAASGRRSLNEYLADPTLRPHTGPVLTPCWELRVGGARMAHVEGEASADAVLAAVARVSSTLAPDGEESAEPPPPRATRLMRVGRAPLDESPHALRFD